LLVNILMKAFFMRRGVKKYSEDGIAFLAMPMF